jgi:hypothetical protein
LTAMIRSGSELHEIAVAHKEKLQMKTSRFLTIGVLFTAGALISAHAAIITPGECIGNCGLTAPNGDVITPPSGNTTLTYVSTVSGVSAGGALPVGAVGGETDGSTLSSALFSANVGDPLNFDFLYITSDGTSSFQDYGWAALMNADGTEAALLFTGRTEPTPTSIVPGAGLPAPQAILTPSSVPILNGPTSATGTVFNQLGGYSGECFDGIGEGCGNSGWVSATFMVPKAGNYFFAYGVTNYGDTLYDSALVIDTVTVGSTPVIGGAPEPGTLAMLVFGLGAIGLKLRRRQLR